MGHEHTIVEAIGETGRGELHILRSLQLYRRIRLQRLEGDQGPPARATDEGVHTVCGVGSGKTKIHRDHTHTVHRHHIEFVRRVRLVRIHQPIDAIVLEIEVSTDRVEIETRRIAQTLCHLEQGRSGHGGATVDDLRQVDGFILHGA